MAEKTTIVPTRETRLDTLNGVLREKERQVVKNVKNVSLDRPVEEEDSENDTEIKDDSCFIYTDLPEGVLLFSSPEGRKVFFETASTGYLNSYWELAQHFLTSSEPYFGCGLATMTMCLNTFHADPGRVWKDIYRWYAQTILEYCVPYRIIQEHGTQFQQFACMADCNYLKVAMVRNVKPTASIDEFREICKRTTSGQCDEILVVCYVRVGLGLRGTTGHYSPIGGYHPEKDLVLLFDVSRYKYPLHWVPVKRLWQAMALVDEVTGHPRGYFVLRKRKSPKEAGPLFKTVSLVDSPTHHRGWLKLVRTVLLPWQAWMQNVGVSSFDERVTLGNVVEKLLELMMSGKCTGLDHLDGIHIRLEFGNADSSLRKRCLVCGVRETIEQSSVWKCIIEEISAKQPQLEEQQLEQQHHQQKPRQQQRQEEQQQQQSTCHCWSHLINKVSENSQTESQIICCNIDIQPSSCHLWRFNLAHYVAMILLSWPYDMNGKDDCEISTGICSAMRNLVTTELSNLNDVFQEEVLCARNRFLSTCT